MHYRFSVKQILEMLQKVFSVNLTSSNFFKDFIYFCVSCQEMINKVLIDGDTICLGIYVIIGENSTTTVRSLCFHLVLKNAKQNARGFKPCKPLNIANCLPK